MSDYGYDEPRRYKSTRTRPREPEEPEYVRETTYIERGAGHGPRDGPREVPRDLAYRPQREDSVEDIPRDRIPRRYDDYYDAAPPPRRARSVGRKGGYYDDDDRYDDYAAPAAAGAAAGNAAGRGRDRRQRERRRDRDGYHSEHSPRRERRKSGLEDALAGFGLGGLLGGGGAKRDGGRRRDSRSSSRSRSRGEKTERKWAQAAQAALLAGAVEAFRSRKEPGAWTGEKGRRIATAALSAGGIDGLVDRDPNKKTKRHLVEAVIGGLAANRLANGPADKDGRTGRSRSRSVSGRGRSRRPGSQSPNGNDDSALKKLAAGGALAAAGKAIYDRLRSKSRRRSPSNSSSDSYVPSRRRGRNPGYQARDGPPGGYANNNNAVARGAATGAGAGAGAYAGGGRPGAGGKGENHARDDSSSSISSAEMEERHKKFRTKEFVTAGLATVATIHAAHGVYASMTASEKRHRLVAEGEMSPEEARKRRSKAWLQDAAAIGIAALGIKGAYSEWKEMNEQRHQVAELETKRRKRQKKRQERMRQQQQGIGNGYGGGGGGRPQGMIAGPPGPPYGYADGGAYGNLSPPPMGGGRYS